MRVRRAKLLAAANRDLLDIFEWIAQQAQDVATAERFVARLRDRCDEIASLPGTLGREREDLGPDLRSFAWRSYVIVFRYAAGAIEIIRILHGMRDLPHAVPPDSEG